MKEPLCLSRAEAALYCERYGNRPEAVAMARACVGRQAVVFRSAGVSDRAQLRELVAATCLLPRAISSDPRENQRLCEM